MRKRRTQIACSYMLVLDRRSNDERNEQTHVRRSESRFVYFSRGLTYFSGRDGGGDCVTKFDPCKVDRAERNAIIPSCTLHEGNFFHN